MYPIFIYWLAKRSFYFCNNNQLTISFIIDILEYAASYKIDHNYYFLEKSLLNKITVCRGCGFLCAMKLDQR